jgi:hypothetical protein
MRGETPALLDPSETANLKHWMTYVAVEVEVILRLTVSRLIYLGISETSLMPTARNVTSKGPNRACI